ncbi:unnamed protein product [Prunus armeniaca]
MISLGRLDRYMMSRELVEDAAKRDKGCDSRTAVEVKNGPFSCADESKEEDLKHVNLNVNKGGANLRMDFHNNGSNEWFGFRMEMLGSLVFCISTVFMFLLPSSIIKPGASFFFFQCDT